MDPGASTRGQAVIRVEGLRKVYDTQVAVDDFTFQVAPGEVMGFVGPNGAGKTTALRVISGVLPPTAGRAWIGENEITLNPVAAKGLLGFVPDTPELFPHLTVGEHLEFVGRVRGLPDRDERAARLLDELEIADRRDHLPETLSRGMKQKVAIAWAFLHDSLAILLDEPLSGLDPHGIRTVRNTIRKRSEKGAAVVISSHQLELIEAICDSILIISHGKQLARGPIAELKEQVKGDASLEEVFFQVTGDGGSPGAT